MRNGSQGDRSWHRFFYQRILTQRVSIVRQRRRRFRAALIEALEPRQVLSGTPLISEFLAGNSGGPLDADGESSDWIEIYNPTAAPVNLANWSLTDDPGDLNKWDFPAVTIGANQYLTVFASNKNRIGPELHTNFKLSADGDYLALVDPSNVVASAYAPAYPTQISNISYGMRFDTAKLIEPGANVQYQIPSSGALGNTWTTSSFNPTGWSTGTSGVGFGVVHPGFNVLYAKANIEVSNLGVARNVITDPGLRSLTLNTTATVVNYMGNGGGGHYGSDFAFPNQTIGDDINDFVVQATGIVTIPTAGQWTFGVNSDDGFELKLERSGVVFTSEFFNPRGPSDTLATFNIPTAGDWNISALMYERGGGASFEMFAAPGAQGSWTAGAFDLVGDVSNGGLVAYAPIGVGSGVVVGSDVRAPMQNINATAYVRVPFTVANPAAFDALQLHMQYDDGFVAYLNGVEVARRNAPTSVAFNSTATTDRTLAEATTPESINLTPYLNLLQTGNNVLAIQGLNSSSADDSFLVLPQLVASKIYTDQLRYFKTPSPGGPNFDPALGVIDRVSASVPAGFYNSAISVALTTPSPGATIRYTTNGSEPTASNGTVYSGPIAISSTTALRAGAFRTDYLSLPTITRSYIFLNDVILQSPSDDAPGGIYPDVGAPPPGWPATWGSNVVDYGMDQTIINQAGAEVVKAALLAMPSMSITTDLAHLFNATTGIYANAGQDGRDWERPASVELINPDGSAGFQANAGLRIRGGFSRSPDNPKHAFRIFFRGEYGDATLEYPLFGSAGTNSFKKFDLRTAQNYSWSFGGDPSNTMIQDGFARQAQGDMGQPYTRSKWVHLYLDGQYWGIFQIEERPEAEYAASYFGGNAANYDVIKPEAGVYTNYATDGNQDAYQRLWQYVTTENLADNARYFRIQGKNALGVNDPSIPNADVLLDVDNLIVYMLGILHGGNLDAPISAFLGNNGINNYFAIRDRTGRSGFKFIQHDAEHTLRNVNENRNGPYPAGQNFDRFNPQFLHQQLMANAEYRLKFADKVQQFFFGSGPMTAAASIARFESDVARLDQAIIGESARWGDAKRPTAPLGRTDWLNALNSTRNFLNNRNPILIAQFIAIGLFPAVGAAQFLVNGVPQDSGQVSPGSLLRFSAPAGLVYYTTNGADPRQVGGAINPAALSYNLATSDTTLVAANSSWKYHDQGANLGTSWQGVAYNDTSWATGNAEFGYGDSDETTVVGYGPDVNNRYVTTYFRKSFSIAETSGLMALKLRLKRDDGAVVYVNGVEAVRSNMPTGTIHSTTFASSTVGGADEQTFYEFVLSPGLLQAGSNVIAVEVHQSVANSSDVSFDATLIATVQTSPPIVLGTSTHFFTRVLNGGVWSALTEANYSTAIPATATNLAITEIHYNPAPQAGASSPPFNDAQNFEFLEFRNTGSASIDLYGVQFTSGITFDFTTADIQTLPPGQHVVLVKNREAFEARYGTSVPIAGSYTGSLDNGGERLRYVGAAGVEIQDFTYDDNPGTTPPWPITPDGAGPSLTVISVTADYDLPASWRPSHVIHGTPGVGEANTLVVTSMTPTTTGFAIDFNRDLDPSQLNLYDASGAFGAADVVLTGGTAGNIRGSVIVSPNLRRITFVATNGRLPADSYTVTLRSADNGFRDASLGLLDGNANGTVGDNFVQSFTVNAPPANAVAISLPNFSRGPQQPVNLPASSTSGIPISFSDGGGLTSASFELRYDPALLTVSTAALAPGMPVGATVNLNTATPGLAVMQFTSPTPLPAGTTRFVDLQASVPSTASYRTKQVLDLANIALNAGSIPGLDDDAVQIAAYFGDTTGNGAYSAQDASRLSRLAVGLDSGLQLYRLLDPIIVADITGNAAISSTDTSRVLQAAVAVNVPEIPPLPNPAVSLTQGGPDPKLSIPSDLVASTGGRLQIPVHIDSIVDLTGNGLESADVVLYYDPAVLDISGIALGSLVADSGPWFVASNIDPLAGRIFISLAGSIPLEGFFQGELAQLHAAVKENARPGPTAINLAASSRDPSRFTQLNEGYLTLIPAPTDAANDSIDGRITVVTAAPRLSSSAQLQLLGDRLHVSGTDRDERIFISRSGDDSIAVRVNNNRPVRFSVPRAIELQGFAETDQINIERGLRVRLNQPATSTEVDLALFQWLLDQENDEHPRATRPQTSGRRSSRS